MAQFDEEIAALKQKLANPRINMIEREATIQHLEKLMRLDGWEPPGLAESVDALEAQLKRLEEVVHSLVERVGILERPGKGPIGFGKSD